MWGSTYDAARSQVELFGGTSNGDALNAFGDTWTWDGTDWTQRPAGSLARLSPPTGPPATVVTIQGWGFAAHERVSLRFVDSTLGSIFLTRARADATGAFTAQVTIPLSATLGTQHVKARGLTSGEIAKRPFTVT